MAGKAEKEVVEALKRPGALPALLTSAGVFAFLLARNVLNRLLESAATAHYANGPSDSNLGSVWATELADALGGPLFFAFGVFLCLWQIAPIAPELRLAHVVTRAALAAVVGSAFLGVLKFVAGLIFAAVNLELHRHPELFGWIAFDSLISTLSTLLGLLPLVVLAAVFLWGWVQRHPPKKAVKGTLDEV